MDHDGFLFGRPSAVGVGVDLVDGWMSRMPELLEGSAQEALELLGPFVERAAEDDLRSMFVALERAGATPDRLSMVRLAIDGASMGPGDVLADLFDPTGL